MYEPRQTFPHWVLPSLFQDALKDLCALHQAPLPMNAAALFASFAHAAQGLITVQRAECGPTTVGLYIFVVSLSGERKTSVSNRAFAAHKQFKKRMTRESEKHASDFLAEKKLWQMDEKDLLKKLASTRGNETKRMQLLSDLKSHYAKSPKSFVVPHAMIKDASPERISQLIARESPYAMVLAGEGRAFTHGRAFQNPDLWCEFWDGEAPNIRRVTGDIEPIADPSVTLLAMPQPGAFQDLMKKKGAQLLDIGFFARTLIMEPVSTQGARFAGPDDSASLQTGLKAFDARVLQMLEQTFDRVQNGSFERQAVTFDEKGASVWKAYLDTVERACAPGGVMNALNAYAAKEGEQVARMAALFAFADDRVEINASDADSAIQLAYYFRAEYIRLFHPAPPFKPLQVEADASALESWLQTKVETNKHCIIPNRMILNKGPRNRDADLRDLKRRDAALLFLKAQMKIRLVYDDKDTEYVNYRHRAWTIPISNLVGFRVTYEPYAWASGPPSF